MDGVLFLLCSNQISRSGILWKWILVILYCSVETLLVNLGGKSDIRAPSNLKLVFFFVNKCSLVPLGELSFPVIISWHGIVAMATQYKLDIS